MIDFIKMIMDNILVALYQMSGFSFVMAILFMFIYMFANVYGWKKIILDWIKSFKQNSVFRKVFLLAFYTAMILFRTLLNRKMWENPLSNVIGVWGVYSDEGELVTEAIENFVLFLPFVIILFCSLGDRIFRKQVKLQKCLWYSLKIVFTFSFTIECTQLFFRLGTFQLSDLFYNTFGGCLGGVLYWCGYKISNRRKTK